MRLGVISDTHGNARNTLDGLRVLDSLAVDEILHCGDIGSITIPMLFEQPTHFVFGNVDGDEADLRDAIRQAGHTCHGRFGELSRDGCRIAFLHGDDEGLWRRTVHSGEFALICSGHTHRFESRLVGATRVLNPGAVYRATPHTVAIVDLPSLAVERLEC